MKNIILITTLLTLTLSHLMDMEEDHTSNNFEHECVHQQYLEELLENSAPP